LKPNNMILFTLLMSLLVSDCAWSSEAPVKADKKLPSPIGTTATKEAPADQIAKTLSLTELLVKQGQSDLAIQELKRILPLVKEKGTPRQQMTALNQLGALLIPFPYPVDEGSMATNDIVRSMKNSPPDTGKSCLTEALAIASNGDEKSMKSSILNNLGTLYWTRNQYEEAATYYLESVQLARQLGGGELLGSALANLGRLYVSTYSDAEASKNLDEAYRIWSEQPDSRNKAEALISIGQNFRRLASSKAETGAIYRSKAATVLEGAVSSAKEIKDSRLTSYALGYLGGVSEESGDGDKALIQTRQALFHAQTLNAPELLYIWQWQLGRILHGKGETAPAISAYRMAVSSLQSVRRSIKADSVSSVLSFSEMVEPVYLGLTEILLKESDTASEPEIKAQLLKQVQEAIENLRTAELQDYFKDSCIGDQIRGGATAAPAVRTAVVYLISMPNRLELLLTLPSGLKHITSEFGVETVTTHARDFARHLSSASDKYLRSSTKLYDIIIRPIEGELKREKIEHLVIVPDGILRTIPMAALYDGKDFLVSKYTISTTQGLQLVNQAPPAELVDREVLMAGISESVNDFPALPSVRSELDGIQNIFSGKMLLNNKFTKDSLKNEIDKASYSYIHLATHGEFAGDMHNMFILAWDGLITSENLNSFIRPTKHRSKPIELLTLSACKTAAGDDRAVLGLAGIAVKAGAKSTLATLWEINDKVTSELIQEFYRNLKKAGTSKAAALQQAQLEIMRVYKHPFYWAPFLLIGNWL
jgi:CHAT domain-containing protein